jgi:hypothetical protein
MEKIIGMSNAIAFLILTSCTVGLALVAFVFVSGQVPNTFIKQV